MNNRVKYLRVKELTLSQKKFGDKIGLGQSTINDIEKGKTSIKERHIKLICHTFNVREEWLRDGTEPIFNEEKENDLIESLKIKYSLDTYDLKFLNNFLSLSSEQRKLIYSVFSVKE